MNFILFFEVVTLFLYSRYVTKFLDNRPEWQLKLILHCISNSSLDDTMKSSTYSTLMIFLGVLAISFMTVYAAPMVIHA